MCTTSTCPYKCSPAGPLSSRLPTHASTLGQRSAASSKLTAWRAYLTRKQAHNGITLLVDSRSTSPTTPHVCQMQQSSMGPFSNLLLVVCRQQNAATRIQTAWRAHSARCKYALSKRRIVRLQCLWRSKLARRELRRRRQAARAAEKILQDKKDLEGRVAELQRILEQARVERSNFRQNLRVAPSCISDFRRGLHCCVLAEFSQFPSSFDTAAQAKQFSLGRRPTAGPDMVPTIHACQTHEHGQGQKQVSAPNLCSIFSLACSSIWG